MKPRLDRLRTQRPQDDFSKQIVILSFVLLIIYTTVVLIIFARTGLEPVTLTQYFFGAIVGEFSFLGSIKVVKEIVNYRKRKREEGM